MRTMCSSDGPLSCLKMYSIGIHAAAHSFLVVSYMKTFMRRWVWLSGGQFASAGSLQPRPLALPALTQQWRHGELSNLEYLLHLNRLAGRRTGNHAAHPVLPWVLDMTQPPEPGMQVSANI